jgi:MtN3 and saliva related transmembrane protein
VFHPEVLGYIAAFLTTAAFFPQTIKTIRTRDTKSISLAMYVMFTSGIALWLMYGLLVESMPLIFANSVTFVLALTILILKLREPKASQK